MNCRLVFPRNNQFYSPNLTGSCYRPNLVSSYFFSVTIALIDVEQTPTFYNQNCC